MNPEGILISYCGVGVKSCISIRLLPGFLFIKFIFSPIKKKKKKNIYIYIYYIYLNERMNCVSLSKFLFT